MVEAFPSLRDILFSALEDDANDAFEYLQGKKIHTVHQWNRLSLSSIRKLSLSQDALLALQKATGHPPPPAQPDVDLLLAKVFEQQARLLEERDAKLLQQQQRLLEEQQRLLEEHQERVLQKIEIIRQQTGIHVTDLKSPSDSERGYQLLNHCTSIFECITDRTLQQALSGDAANHARLSVEDLQRAPLLTADRFQALFDKLDSKCSEAEFVALMTPVLLDVIRRLPDTEQVLVNSEQLGWIRTDTGVEEYFQKPDLFVCHRSVFTKGTAPAGESAASDRARQLREESGKKYKFCFGRCVWALRDAVECIIEAKRGKMSSNEAIGECFVKAQNFLRGSMRVTRKVLLFDAECLLLLVFTSNGLLSLQKLKWTEPGSFVVLLDFLHAPTASQPEWLRVLRSACLYFGVRVSSSDSFLGQGATGRVFRVLQPAETDDEPGSALKIVEGSEHGEHITTLRHEVDELTRLLQQFPVDHSVRRHIPDWCSELYIEKSSDGLRRLGAAAMFRHVGTSLAGAIRTASLWAEVWKALAALHAAGIFHGDPRLPNIIRPKIMKPRQGPKTRATGPDASISDGEYLVWIDFRTSAHSATAADRSYDCLLLLRSFFNVQGSVDISQLHALADVYGEIPPESDISAFEDWSQRVWNDCSNYV